MGSSVKQIISPDTITIPKAMVSSKSNSKVNRMANFNNSLFFTYDELILSC